MLCSALFSLVPCFGQIVKLVTVKKLGQDVWDPGLKHGIFAITGNPLLLPSAIHMHTSTRASDHYLVLKRHGTSTCLICLFVCLTSQFLSNAFKSIALLIRVGGEINILSFIFMRTSPIVGGNGNTLKLKTKAKLNDKQNLDRHGLRPIYATFPTLVVSHYRLYLSIAKLKGTSQISIFRVLPNWKPLRFQKPSGFDTGRRKSCKIYCKVDTESYYIYSTTIWSLTSYLKASFDVYIVIT